MRMSKAQYIEETKRVTDQVRSAAWGIRGVASALTKHDLDCEIEECGELSGQDISDLHCAALSLSRYIDEKMQWFDSANIEEVQS